MEKETMAQHRAQTLVYLEQRRQESLWGQQDHKATRWALILQEEVGELAKAVLNGDAHEITDELVQVAAVARTWLESTMGDDEFFICMCKRLSGRAHGAQAEPAPAPEEGE